MNKHFQLEITPKKVAVLTFKNASLEMNVLSEEVLKELDGFLDDFKGNKEIKGLVIISGRPDQFVVGASIEEISYFTSANQAANGATAMQGIYNKLDSLGIPTVAAIHGNCLGGGLEMALACKWRVVTTEPNTLLALPEIQLGLIPGAGGTQRLPRLVGIQAALDMILTGRRLNGAKALKTGLADALVPKDLLLATALDFATKKRSSESKTPSRGFSLDLTRWALEGNPLGRSTMLSAAKKNIDEKTKGHYPAPYKALTAVFEGFDKSLTEGLKLEASLFGDLAMTQVSQSLIHLFHATTALKKNPYKKERDARFGERAVSKVGVIGAGFMGSGIATVCADKNLQVLISDPNKESIGKGLKSARSFFGKKLDQNRMKPFEASGAMARISPGLTTIGFEKTDITIEAAPEVLSIKQKILADLEKTAGTDWIFATNTSALPLNDIAASAKDPSRVIGMHFFSPVEKMPLLEIVKTKDSAPWAVGRGFELGQAMGKTMIVVNDGPGFYTTRALAFFLSEAATLLIEGQSIERIDKALVNFGFPVGPLALIDEVGLDIGQHVLETIEKAFPDRLKQPPGFDGILKSGRLGRKNGKGFYRYESGEKKGPDESILEFLPIKKNPVKLSDSEIVDRCLYVFMNETARCLDEGILASAYDGDIGAVFGLGFPAFWGGPLKTIDLLGIDTVYQKLKNYEKQLGPRYAPAPSIQSAFEKKTLFFPGEPIKGKDKHRESEFQR
jgi:3-hydroxyacyl-CoA dehydrogenase/enoyl-CoA hydratase/3-hydroxybutyryl-CoA epimerase